MSTLTTPTNNKIPIVDTSTAETRVMVKSGSTVIIGGLRKEEKKTTDKKLPILGDIPLLGRTLFGNRAQDNQIQEMVVLITPHIMGGEALVTGDELEIGGKFQSFHDYPPLAGGEAPATLEMPEAVETAP